LVLAANMCPVAVSNATAATVIDFPLNIALLLVHIIPITPSTSRTIPARFTRGRVCGPPPFNYRIALHWKKSRDESCCKSLLVPRCQSL
jgi:hypothetical protein